MLLSSLFQANLPVGNGLHCCTQSRAGTGRQRQEQSTHHSCRLAGKSARENTTGFSEAARRAVRLNGKPGSTRPRQQNHLPKTPPGTWGAMEKPQYQGCAGCSGKIPFCKPLKPFLASSKPFLASNAQSSQHSCHCPSEPSTRTKHLLGNTEGEEVERALLHPCDGKCLIFQTFKWKNINRKSTL